MGHLQPQDSTAQAWNDQSQSLQSPNQDAANLTAEPLLNPGHFSATNQSQDTRNFYAPSGTHNGASEMLNVQDPFSLSISAINGESPLSDNNLWGESLVSPGPPWLIGYDFDLEALNISVSTTLDIPEPLFQSRLMLQDSQPNQEDQSALAAEVQRRQKSGADKVHAAWFTQIEHDGHGVGTHGSTNTKQLTPVTEGNQHDIGDNFRSCITARLKAPTFDDPLPSTKFLVGCHFSCLLYPSNTNQLRIILCRFTSPNLIRLFL